MIRVGGELESHKMLRFRAKRVKFSSLLFPVVLLPEQPFLVYLSDAYQCETCMFIERVNSTGKHWQTQQALLLVASIQISDDNCDEYFTVTECGSQGGSEVLQGVP